MNNLHLIILPIFQVEHMFVNIQFNALSQIYVLIKKLLHQIQLVYLQLILIAQVVQLIIVIKLVLMPKLPQVHQIHFQSINILVHQILIHSHP